MKNKDRNPDKDKKRNWIITTRTLCGTVIDSWVIKQVPRSEIFELASKDRRVSDQQVEEWTVVPQNA